MILNLEETFLEIVNCEETPQGDFETTLETDNKVMLESVSKNIHERLTSTVLSSHEIVNIVSPSNVNNSSTMDCESIENGSSVNSFRNSAYVTQEATAISMVLGDTSELKKYDTTKHLWKQSKSSDYFLYNMLMDLQIVLQTKVSGKVSALKQELDEWEISFLVNNQLCSPAPSDYQNNSNIANICKKISIGKQLLGKWNIPF